MCSDNFSIFVKNINKMPKIDKRTPVTVTYTFPDGTTGTFTLAVANLEFNEDFTIEYVSPTSGGPLMRPALPPGA